MCLSSQGALQMHEMHSYEIVYVKSFENYQYKPFHVFVV